MKVNPDNAGFDEQRLERITEHIQERYIDAGRIAGAQMAVFRHGQVGYFRSFGARDLERGKPVEEDTIWRIYSMTKPITGVALLSLYERGLFQLDDKVSRFIPEWRGLQVKERDADGNERLVAPRPRCVGAKGSPGLWFSTERASCRLRPPGMPRPDMCIIRSRTVISR